MKKEQESFVGVREKYVSGERERERERERGEGDRKERKKERFFVVVVASFVHPIATVLKGYGL